MQFDVYENIDQDTKKLYPYFVDIQTNLLDTLNSRVVIPLTPVDVNKEYPRNLCPMISIGKKDFALLSHQITSVPIGLLKRKAVSAKDRRLDIVSAIDFLVTGI